MGVRMPGVGQYEPLVEKLIAVEKQPIEVAKQRREKVVKEKAEVEKLQTYLGELDGATNAIKSQQEFYKLKVESSHPDIIDGTIKGITMLGNYEFEVRGMARTDKQLAFGFPDKDKTPVGFGYMQVEREDMEPAEITIEPDSTLQDVAQQINEASLGVRAMVINTKFTPDSYRLLVVSEKSGAEAKINIDPDTTFLEFKEQVAGRNLDVLFEDVPVTDDDNQLDELVEGLAFDVKRAEAGTRVQVSVVHDMDATMLGISTFVEKYNQVVQFAAEQSKSPLQGNPGVLAGDGSVRQVMRGLQDALYPMNGSTSKYSTLSAIGISTNPKTGELTLDATKVKAALTEDYDGVAALFIRSRTGEGVGERLSSRIQAFRDPSVGVVKSRIRGLETIITNQDKDIGKRERQLEDKEGQIKRRFASLEGQMNNLQAQGSFLQQRFGGEGGGGQ